MIYLAVKYAIFAGIATATNIGTQYGCMMIYDGPFSLYAAMAAGTLAGLVVKYVLDKRFIFYHKTAGAKDDLVKFFIYTFMGVFTTVIFWGSELFFNYLFQFPQAKYLGAVIGLSIGYITKYNLDKRFVFKDWQKQVS